MDNYKLLEKYRKKLSIGFAIFILMSIWITVLFFDLSTFISNEKKDKTFLENKISQIKNVIQNKNIYSKVNELTLQKVIDNVYSNSAIFSKNLKVISKIDDFNNFNILDDNKIKIIGKYKYYKESYIFEGKPYNLITRKEILISNYELIINYLYFIIFTIPFGILFYFFGYFFVGKNLKPLEENISNLEDFVGNINHEFKTPLSEIISSLELSKKTMNYENAVNQSITSANKLNKILNSLVGLIKLSSSSYKKENTDLVIISNNIINKYREKVKEKNIKLDFKTSKKTIFKNIIIEHFEICFSNLLSNSIKYNREGGKISIYLDNNYLKISDNGIGIDKKNLPKIFNRYFREGYVEKGDGIGLSIVKKIVDTNNWKIKIASEKDIGTEIIISL